MGSIVYREGEGPGVVQALLAWACLLGAVFFGTYLCMRTQGADDEQAAQLATKCERSGLVLGAEVRIKGDSRAGAVVGFWSYGVRVRIAVENNFWTGPYVYGTFKPEQLEVVQSKGRGE